MNVTFEKTGDARGVITVEVAEVDYEGKFNADLKRIGKEHVIPGFRKGHISLPELKKRFGSSVKSDVINKVVFEAVFDYLKESKVKVLGQPMPSGSTEINLTDKDYTFKYDVALWPELGITLDKSVTMPFYRIEVTEDAITEQDKALVERFGTQQPGEEVDNKAVIKGSIQELNPDGSVKEGEDAIQVVSGIVAPFLFKGKEEGDKFIGKHVNDKVVFNPAKACEGNEAELAAMLNIEKEAAANVTADFEFAIAEIIVVKPAEHNQEFFDDVFGKDKVHNEEEYHEAIKNLIAQQLLPNSFQMSNRDITDYLMETYGPAVKMDDELVTRWIKLNDPEFKEEDLPAILPQLKWDIISEDVKELLNVEVTDQQVEDRACFIAAQQMRQYGMYNMDEETIRGFGRQILEDKKLARQIHQECENEALYNAVREAVTMDDKTISLDEFKKLANPNATETESAE